MSKENNKSNAKRVLAWIFMALAVVAVAFAIVSKTNHWPGANLELILIPVWVMLFVVGIVLLRSANKKFTHTDSTLAVDYRVRYLIGKTMRTKRWMAWVTTIVGAIAAICAIVKIIIGWQEVPFVLAILLSAVALITIGLTTIRTSKRVESAMAKGDQADFNHAMRRWTFRCRLATWCYLTVMLGVATFIIVMEVLM